jgi:hypothetical protein
MIKRCENNVWAVHLTEKLNNSGIETMDHSFSGRLLPVKNQILRNVTGATLNKYTESQAKQKHFIREMYTANVVRHLIVSNHGSYRLIITQVILTGFVLQLLNAD